MDATLIESLARPRRTIEMAVDEDGEEIIHEDGTQPGVVRQVHESADSDASWVKKGKRSYFGYRAYVLVDSEEGYVRGVHTAPANQSETKHMGQVLEASQLDVKRLYADKGYSSAANQAYLKEKKIKVGLMHRATKHKPLAARQKKANKLIGKVRYFVEQCFGTADFWDAQSQLLWS